MTQRSALGLAFGVVFGSGYALWFAFPPRLGMISIVVSALTLGTYGLLMGRFDPNIVGKWSDLFWQVGWPLVSFATLSFGMSRVITESDVSGLFANLSAGLIGSMITVFYIEIVQRYHEEARWKNVDHLIAEEVVAAASGAIAQIEAVICRHFGITSDRIIMEVGEGIIVQDSTIDEQYMSFIEENVICRLDEALQEFADEEWNLLSSSLSRIYDEFETLQNLYQERLEPEQLARIQKNRTTSRGVRDTIQAKLWSTDLLISLTAPRVEALLRSSMVLVRDNWSSAWPSRTQRVGSKTQF